ncbi:dihydroneopterin aldolase [Agaribacterium sp. ZY112]|uniref:dihydroneopterin aldolase n=1 Tax=Agaribacterium sp. ZY112 TaxID=3233574 RepID=UPI003524F57F
MDTVFIRDLEVATLIGVYDHEKLEPQPLLFDLDMAWDCQKACVSDRLTDTLDYHAVCIRIERICAETHFELVETLAETIAQCLLNEFKIPGLMLRVSKPQAIANTHSVGIVIRRGIAV